MKNKLVAAAVVALTIALLPFPAYPAPVPTAEEVGRTTVGIRTASQGAPDNRGKYEYEILPKKSKQDAVAVYNYSLKPVTVRLLARDATSTPEGEFTAQPSADAPQDIGAWIALSKTQLKLEPRSMTLVPFQVGVPYNATPGDHVGSILVSLLAKEPRPGSGDVVVEHRVGLRVYLRVPGTLKPQLSIENLEESYDGRWKSLGFGRATVDYTVHNTGNVRLSATQQVEILRSFGLSSASASPEALKELLPNGTAVVHQEFPSTWAVGKVRAKVTLTPAGLDPSVTAVPHVEKEISVFVFPWLLVLILALIAGLIGGGYWRRRRRQAALASGGGPMRPAGAAHKHRHVRVVLGMMAASVLAVGLGTAPGAQAADDVPMWKAIVIPKSGGADDPIELQTSGGCPAPADSILGRVYGKGFPKDGENVIGNTKAGVNPEGPFPAPLIYSMKAFMANQPNPVPLEGTYRFVVTCRTAKYPDSYGDYVAEIRFTSPDKWVAAKPVTNKTGPVLHLDENGDPITPAPGSATPKPGDDPSAQPSTGSGAVPGDPTAAGPAGPLLTDSEEDSDGNALPYVLIIGGLAVAAATVLFVWRRRS